MPSLIAGDMAFAALDEICVGQIAVHHGAVHGEIGRVDLQDQPGLVDCLVSLLHLARDRVEIVVVRVVVGVDIVVEMMPGEAAVMNLSENAQLVGDLLKPRGLVGDRLEIAIFDLGLRLRRALLAFGGFGKRRIRKASNSGNSSNSLPRRRFDMPAKPDMRCGT